MDRTESAPIIAPAGSRERLAEHIAFREQIPTGWSLIPMVHHVRHPIETLQLSIFEIVQQPRHGQLPFTDHYSIRVLRSFIGQRRRMNPAQYYFGPSFTEKPSDFIGPH